MEIQTDVAILPNNMVGDGNVLPSSMRNRARRAQGVSIPVNGNRPMSKLSTKTVGTWLFVLSAVFVCLFIAVRAGIKQGPPKADVVEAKHPQPTSDLSASTSAPTTISKPNPAATVPNVPDSIRSRDSKTETKTYFDGVGRFSFEYPAAWRIIEGQDQVILSSSESNECTVELDFHSWGSVVDPRGSGFDDTAQGACQVYMKDAVANTRPTKGPTNLQITGADEAAWAAWEWNDTITELVVFRAGGLFKKFQLHYSVTASQLRPEALIALQTLRINSRHPQLAMVGKSSQSKQTTPQSGAADEGYVAPPPSFARHAPSAASGSVNNPQSDVKTLIPKPDGSSNPNSRQASVPAERINHRARACLGLQFEAGPFKTPFGDGVLISRVLERLAGAEAEIVARDVIIELDRRRVQNSDDFTAIVKTLEIGKSYPLTIVRGSTRLDLNIIPHDWPDDLVVGVPKTGDDRFDHLFAAEVDLTGGKANLTQEYAKRYPDKEKDTVTFAEFIELQPIVTTLPKIDKATVQTRETTQISLAQYLSVAGEIDPLSDKTRLSLALTDLSKDQNATGFSTLAARVRSFKSTLTPLKVPTAAVPYHHLVLAYSELLAATFDQVANLSKDQVKALVALRQVDAIDRKYYPLIIKELSDLRQSVSKYPRFSKQSSAMVEEPSEVKAKATNTESTVRQKVDKSTEPAAPQTVKPESKVPQFDPDSFLKTKAWLAGMAAKEAVADNLGNAIIAKEVRAKVKAEVDIANGKVIRWTFHVRSVGESSYSIQEQTSVESYLEAVSEISRYGTDHAQRVAETGVLSPNTAPIPVAVFVDLDHLPKLTSERLRELRPGDPIEISGRITDVDLSSAPRHTTFKINVGAPPIDANSEDSKRAHEAELAERALIDDIMAVPLRDAHSSAIKILHTKPFATNVPKTPQPVFSGDGEFVMYPQIQNRRLALVVADLRNHQTITTWIPTEIPSSLWWSQDGKRLAYVSTDGKLHVVMDWTVRNDVTLPVKVFTYLSLTWLGSDKLACAGDGIIDILDLNTLKFEPLVKSDPNWLIRDSDFRQKRQTFFLQKMRDIRSTPRDHPHCRIFETSGSPVQVESQFLFVRERDGSNSQMLLHDFDGYFLRFYSSPDLRHILALDRSKETLTHHFLGLRKEPTKYYRIDLDPSQLPKDEKRQFDSYIEKGRPFWGRVFSPLKNPLNGKVLGPDRKSFKGLANVRAWQNSGVTVGVAAELIHISPGDIITDIQSENWGNSHFDSFSFRNNKWFVLVPDDIAAIQLAFKELKGGGPPLSAANLPTLDEIRNGCDLLELQLGDIDVVKLKAGAKTFEFKTGMRPETFSDNFIAQYQALPKTTKLVLITYSYGDAQFGSKFAINQGLPLAIERMRMDANGGTQFGHVLLGHVPQTESPSPSKTADGAARSGDPIPNLGATPQSGSPRVPGLPDDVLSQPAVGKPPQVEKSESQDPVDQTKERIPNKENLQKQLSETNQKVNAAEADLNQLKQKLEAAQQEIESLKKPDKDPVQPAADQQIVMKPPRRVFGITARKCKEGIHIETITPGGPATRCTDVGSGERLQLEPGDHVLSVNGVEPKTLDEFLSLIASSERVMSFIIKDQRKGKHRRMTTTLD